MKDDYGVRWKRDDYIMALMVVITIITLISIPVFLLLGTVYVFGWQYYWYFFAVAFVSLLGFNVWIVLKPSKVRELKT